MDDDADADLRPITEDMARAQCLSEGVPAPDLETTKDFLRFYISTSRPVISTKPTVDSINTVAEWFFAGFTRVTGTETIETDRKEVYNVRDHINLRRVMLILQWVRRVLTAEGIVVNQRLPKDNFSVENLTHVLRTLWTKDDLSYVPECYRVQFMFIINVYCWTGARLGAFFTGGLEYEVK